MSETFVALALVPVLMLAAAGYVAARRTLARGRPWLAEDEFLGWDKLDHAAWSFALIVALAAFQVHGVQRWVVFAIIAVAVEIVELARYGAWLERGAPSPWPVLADAVSWRDLVWDLIGALAATWCVARIG